MPLPGSKVIDGRWSQHHRPTASAAFDAECQVARADGLGETANDGAYLPPPFAPIYTGPCRVVRDSTERLVISGQAQDTHRRYMVSISYDTAEIKIGDQIHITNAVDSTLRGRTFGVIDVYYGSEQWQRDIVCDELEASV